MSPSYVFITLPTQRSGLAFWFPPSFVSLVSSYLQLQRVLFLIYTCYYFETYLLFGISFEN